MEDYVSFELAKKLKEKGFPQHWSNQVYILNNEYDEEWFEVGAKYIVELVPDFMSTVSAPTVSLVLKWLREKGYHVYAELCYHSILSGGVETINRQWYSFCVSNIRTCECYGDDREFDTCEEAEEAAIEYVLDKLI